jgi:hypothetical protein
LESRGVPRPVDSHPAQAHDRCWLSSHRTQEAILTTLSITSRAYDRLVRVAELEGLESANGEDQGGRGGDSGEYEGLGPAEVGFEVPFANGRDEVSDAEAILADAEVSGAGEELGNELSAVCKSPLVTHRVIYTRTGTRIEPQASYGGSPRRLKEC